MADRTQLRAADHNDIADDDPFAELTRIMGFDPRQPVKPQAPAARKAAPADQPTDEGDFDIDLEKELMGEFGADAGEAAAEVREPAFKTVAADDKFAASFEQDFFFDDAHEVGHHFTAGAKEVQAPAADAAFDDDFDNAVASSLEDVSPLDDDLSMDDELSRSLDQGFQLDDEAADETEDGITVEVAAPAVEAAFGDDFDHAVSTSLEDELMLDDHLPADDHQAGPAAADYPVQVQAVGYGDHSISDADFSGHFDETMADVDMNFEVRGEQPADIDEPLADEMSAETAEAEDDVAELSAQDAFDDDFDLNPGDATAEESAEPVAEIAAVEPVAEETEGPAAEIGAIEPVAEEPAAEIVAVADESTAPAAVAVEPEAAASAAGERSLEDELNALLGAMSARPVPVAREPEPVQQPVAAIEEAARRSTDPDGELDWSLDEQEPSEEPPHQEVVQAADVDLEDRLADELEGQDFGVEEEAPATHSADDIHFDDDAFDTAFAKGIDLDDGAQTGPAEQAASEQETARSPNWSTARSTPPEPARSWSRVTPVPQSQPSFAGQPTASAQPASSAPHFDEEPVEDASGYAEPAETSHEQPQRYDEMPDVETVDVPERVVAVADDLDIPELDFEEDQPTAPAYDDLDAEFASLLTEMNATEVAAEPARSAAYDDESYNSGFKSSHGFSSDPGFNSGYQPERSEMPIYAAKPAAVPANAAASSYAASGFDADDLPGSRPVSQADDFAVDELDYDPDLDEAMSVPGLAESDAARQPRRSGLLIAAVVGAVAIAGGISAFALSLGGKGGGEAPVIVKADNAPIKVKPENPGGTVVPNQDNKVYDAVVKGTKPAEPVQEKLVTNIEEPVDVAAKEPESRVVDLSPDDTDAAQGTDAAGNADVAAAPVPKSEDRIAQVLQEADKGTNSDVIAVAPRKVRTMVVKPDGSLVAREDPVPAAPQVAAAEPVDPEPQHVAPAAEAEEQTGTVPPLATDQADDQSGVSQASGGQTETTKPEPAKSETANTEMADPDVAKPPVAAKPAAAPKVEAKLQPANAQSANAQSGNAQSANTPARVPVAPQRPSDQPVDVVGEVKPDQVASIDPATASTGGGSWSMQIASQPTVESAQSTYQDLQRRYGSVLSGHTASIVKAEIAGKGTFYRVRVPAKSRNDAINLCTSYKAAGGNCFVSR